MRNGFRKKGLFSKLFFSYSLIIAITFILTALVLSLWFRTYYKNERKKQLKSQAQYIIEASKQYFQGEITSDKVNNILEQIGRYVNTEIVVTDYSGYVFGTSNSINKNIFVGKHLIPSKDLEELRSLREIELEGTYGGAFKAPVYTYIIPIYDMGFEGAIIMSTPINEIQEPLNRVSIIIWSSAMLAFLLASIIIYYISHKIIINPLAEINNAAGKISKGEVQKRVTIYSNDEIGELARSFNIMADSLEEVDKNRKEFISNVSHELRSPITSIKGFIGGILDGVVPPEKENYYLSLTYDEIQRLIRLVNDLLDLSTIESGRLRLIMENLDINELIRLTVIKFETKIKDKNLKVDVCLEDDHLFAIGDRDRVLQIITNLIDNAIKYANENGRINIYTKRKGEKILVSIFNESPKINEEQLKHIFDRFYKADKSRTTKMSTGLGLSIVRSILTALGEDIWVNSSDNGVTFTFSLKKL